MTLWKTTHGGRLKYYMARFPMGNLYTSSGPVSSRAEAGAEIALTAAVMLQHQVLLSNIWSAITIEEDRIAHRLRSVKGVLIVAVIYEEDVPNPDVGVARRQFGYLFTGQSGNNYQSVVSVYESQAYLSPAPPSGYHSREAYLWATK